jgi:hypothetical protein
MAQSRRILTLAVPVVGVLAVGVAACGGGAGGDDSDDGRIPCPAAERDAAAFPTPVPAPWEQPGTLIYFLVDREPTNEEYPRQALATIAELLPRIASPGDTVIGAWLGARDSRDLQNEFLRQISQGPPAKPWRR